MSARVKSRHLNSATCSYRTLKSLYHSRGPDLLTDLFYLHQPSRYLLKPISRLSPLRLIGSSIPHFSFECLPSVFVAIRLCAFGQRRRDLRNRPITRVLRAMTVAASLEVAERPHSRLRAEFDRDAPLAGQPRSMHQEAG